MESLAEEILQFWFGSSPERWFAADPGFDAAIRRRFGALPERAASGEFASWLQAPRPALALVLVLDQFPRNLFRGEPRAFAFDPDARAAALAALDAGFDRRLEPLEAAFLYLPLEHAEDLALQERCVELSEELVRRAPPELAAQIEEFAEYARRHRDLIARFGRFPHRTPVLGRAPTPEETHYLESGGERFGVSPAGKRAR